MQASASKTDLLLQCSRPFDPALSIVDEAGEDALYGSAYHTVIEHLLQTAASPIPFLAETAAAYDVTTGLARRTARPTEDGHRYDLRPGELGGTSDLVIAPTSGRLKFAVTMPKVRALWPTVQKAASQWSVSHLAEELSAHLYESAPVLFRWLAERYDSGKKRHLTVLDHKTGFDAEGKFAAPDKMGQLRTLALQQRTLHTGAGPVDAAVFHANRRGLAKVHVETIEPEELAEHHRRLSVAYGRIGDGTLKPGPECTYCPMREVCPAVEGKLLDTGRALLVRLAEAGSRSMVVSATDKLARDERLGLLYDAIAAAEDLGARARAAIRVEMETTGIFPKMPDGRRLVFETIEEERLSKKAFIEAYGKLEAERMFGKWRKAGALVKKPVKRMRVKD